MDTELTQCQSRVMAVISAVVKDTGLPPTRLELMRALGLTSPNAAEKHLRMLESKGLIELSPGISRGIRLKTAKQGLPLIGHVAAGAPILSEAHILSRHVLDPDLFKPRADYLLKVRGWSMRDAGIADGDLLAVHRTTEARSGQIVVARLHDEVTVKRFQRRGQKVELKPENPEFKAIVLDPKRDELVIEGLAVGLIRAGHAL